MRARPRYLWCLLSLLLVVLMLLLRPQAPRNWARVQVGMNQVEVRQLLGSPQRVEFVDRDRRPRFWYYGAKRLEFGDLLTVQDRDP